MINIRDLAAGIRNVLINGAEPAIVDNPKHGVWVFTRYPMLSLSDPGHVEEIIFVQHAIEVRF